ncbi:MAG: ATP-binding protein [Gammaproteobacteria bacterium]|nr:ATP-binding protein [Gammaproteobacteria bacterium]
MNSLEKRLQLALSLILLVASLSAGWLIYSASIKMGETHIQTRLEHDGESLLAAIQFDANDLVTVREERLAGIYHRPFSGHYFHILIDGEHEFHSRSVWDQSFDLKGIQFSDSVAHMVGPNSQHLLLWSGQYRKQGHDITIITAEDLGPLYQQLKRYGLYLLLSIPLFLFFILAIQRLILRHSFKPLDQIEQEIKQLERGEIEQLCTPLPTEIRPLVNEVNRLILAMVERIKRSRNSAGNLAHTLKGPLQLLIQLAESERLTGHDDIRQELLTQVGLIQQQIEQELRRARLAGSATPGQQFRPAEELPLLKKMLQQIYQDKKLELQFSYPESSISSLDRDDMLELIGNLLDNACKWANTKISCSIELNEQISITIEDDGPGCAAEQLEQLTRRGLRVDESTAGHGIGLSIVKEIVESYHGELKFDNSHELGGFRVTITIPR